MALEYINGLELAVEDLNEEKKEFDRALITKEYNTFNYIVWEFDGYSNFACSGFFVLKKDLLGNDIQNISDTTKRMSHIFVTIFPQIDKTYAIFSYTQSNKELFKDYIEQMNKLTIVQRKNYINNLIPLELENVVVKPSAWDSLSDTKKQEFDILFHSQLIDFEGISYSNILEATSYDFFSL